MTARRVGDEELDSVVGHFHGVDVALFRALLDATATDGAELLRVHAPAREGADRPLHPMRRYVPPIAWPAARKVARRLGLAPGD